MLWTHIESLWDGDTYSYHLYVNGKKELSAWTHKEVEERAEELRAKEAEKLPKITASDFCRFFDFALKKEHGTVEGGVDEYEYIVTDAQGTFQPRYVEKISDLVDCFDSMLEDYVDETLNEYGFPYTTSADEPLPSYYEQAQGWIENTCKQLLDSETYKVICALTTMGATITADI